MKSHFINKKNNKIKDNLCNIHDETLDYHEKLKNKMKRSFIAKTQKNNINVNNENLNQINENNENNKDEILMKILKVL